jgi:ABC-type glycerol-3-phosphate transport system substrate-binding protein
MMKKWLIISLLVLTLAACSENAWEESPTFTADGETMQGVENRLAFSTASITPVKAGDTNKYMWHFWSKDDDYFGKFEVVAVHEKNGKTVHVYGSPNSDTAQPLHGAQHHLPSLMTLPDAGMWRIDVMFDTVLFDSVYIHVVE